MPGGLVTPSARAPASRVRTGYERSYFVYFVYIVEFMESVTYRFHESRSNRGSNPCRGASFQNWQFSLHSPQLDRLPPLAQVPTCQMVGGILRSTHRPSKRSSKVRN